MELIAREIARSPRERHRGHISIKGFLETSFVDWSGKVVSVLFLPGCNFRCPFCHNHSLVLNPEQYEDIPLSHVLERLVELRRWIDGVCISGGEPTIHSDLPLLMAEIKALGLSIKLDTNGSQPHMLRSLVDKGLVDFVAMDIKAPLDELCYARAAGMVVDLDTIRESIALLQHGKAEYQLRITIVPALHREEDLLHLAHQLRGTSSLTPQNFNPQDPLDEELKGISPYPDEWIREIGEKIAVIVSS